MQPKEILKLRRVFIELTCPLAIHAAQNQHCTTENENFGLPFYTGSTAERGRSMNYGALESIR
jgi:hypothetical protein